MGGGVVCHSIEVCGQWVAMHLLCSILSYKLLLASLPRRNPTLALSESGVLLHLLWSLSSLPHCQEEIPHALFCLVQSKERKGTTTNKKQKINKFESGVFSWKDRCVCVKKKKSKKENKGQKTKKHKNTKNRGGVLCHSIEVCGQKTNGWPERVCMGKGCCGLGERIALKMLVFGV